MILRENISFCFFFKYVPHCKEGPIDTPCHLDYVYSIWTISNGQNCDKLFRLYKCDYNIIKVISVA